MAATILHLDDKAHAWNPGVTVTASSTQSGKAENVRDATFGNWWKPNDGTSDEWIEFAGPSQGWLGTVGGDDTQWLLSFDASGCDQNVLRLYRESSEGSGIWSSNIVSHTVNKGGETSATVVFNMNAGGRTKYRLYQLNSDRSGGTKTIKIHHWGMVPLAGWFDVESTLVSNVSPHPTNWQAHVGVAVGPGGFVHTQRRSAMTQDFQLNIKRTKDKATWAAIVDGLNAVGNSARAFYVTFDGLKNYTLLDTSMVRIKGDRWSAGRPYVDNYDISVPITTEAHQ